MSDPDLPEGGGRAEHDRSFPRIRNFLRKIGASARWRELARNDRGARHGRYPPSRRARASLIGNILKVHNRTAADVMVPRIDIIALHVDTPFPEVVKCMVEQGHSRVPVYRETLDDVIGFIHVKDVRRPVAARQQTKLSPLLRKVLFVAPVPADPRLLVQMRQARTHIAMVLDEFGGIDGLVTIEDLIEEIVGEIEDEHDVAETPNLTERADGTPLSTRELQSRFWKSVKVPELRPTAEQEEVDTLGGLVSSLAGRVPKRGEVIAHPMGVEFEVLDADPRRIKRLRVRSPPGAADGRGTAGV